MTHAPENPHDPVLLSIENGIARLTLNRPERHNSLVPELVESLNQAIDQATRANPKVLVLDANGQSFSTGGDVQGLFDTPFDLRHGYARKLVGGLHDAILALIGMPCPTIAVVQGMVTGGSVGLVLACDLVIGTDKASFAPWYTVVGYSPDGGWATLMADRIGRSRTLAIHLTNQKISAGQARDLGLLHQIVEPDQLQISLKRNVQTLNHAIPGAVSHTLAQLRPDLSAVREGLNREMSHFLEQISTKEAESGMKRFLARASRPEPGECTDDDV